MYGSTMTAPLVSGKAQPHERIGYSAESRPIRAAAVAQTRADFDFGPDAPEDHGHDVAEFPVEAIAGLAGADRVAVLNAIAAIDVDAALVSAQTTRK
jgi:hypothetical protein